MSRAQEAHDEAHEPMSDTEWKILERCSENLKSTAELLIFLRYQSCMGNFKRAVSHLLEMGLMEMTVSTGPGSKKQKQPSVPGEPQFVRSQSGRSNLKSVSECYP